ncbi:MAG: hypothetical protein KC468_02445 [Myxococcales bacterium]|nr:hypothetical protein [Myxococcales bacterium]
MLERPGEPPQYERWGASLDALAERVFTGPEGQERARPLLSAHDRVLGRIVNGDDQHELLRALRIDWALCDACPRDHADAGTDSWAWRVAHERVPGVRSAPDDAAVAGSVGGLFEVWPGRRAWLRDRLSGLSVALDGEVDPRALASGTGPGALWETRVVVGARGAALCRRPIEYPLEIVPMLERAHARAFGERPYAPLTLRRAWLEWRRSRGADPRPIFRAVLE